ncbi:hypothetical protein PFLUV_G00110220 [Perca fluviatilis]|uniref:Uncharacterized protein n=1 Tax=Perca fluviatilis TaxID=8168 RepID=A0A6A5E9N4_PERFL|nr:hypothetical protein PFLUV_G00110220 [Perca fluviatilis]
MLLSNHQRPSTLAIVQYSIVGHISRLKFRLWAPRRQGTPIVASPYSGVHTRTFDLDPGLDPSAQPGSIR